MKGEQINSKCFLVLTLCARSRRLSERLTFFLLKLDAPELEKQNKTKKKDKHNKLNSLILFFVY
jgi:hypothetical protein